MKQAPGSGREPNGSLPETPGEPRKAGNEAQLQIECDPQTRINLGHQTWRDLTNTLGQIVLIQGDHLRNEGCGIFRQTGDPRGQQYVPRGIQQPEVGAKNDGQDGSEATTVESVGLDNKDRAPKSRLGPSGFLEICPPNFPAFDHHSEDPTLRAWAVLNALSTRLGSSV